MTTPHPHKDILIAIANGVSIEQVELQYKNWPDKDWVSGSKFTQWISIPEDWKVRIKQKTIMFNDIELPEPLVEEPKEGEVLYVPDTSSHYLYTVYWYKKADIFERKLKQGLLHANKENAIAWAKAMIPFPQNT